MFCLDPSQNYFLSPHGCFWESTCRRIKFFGPFWVPPWIFKGSKKLTKNRQNVSKDAGPSFTGPHQEPAPTPEAALSAPGFIFGWFWEGFGWIFDEFSMILSSFWMDCWIFLLKLGRHCGVVGPSWAFLLASLFSDIWFHFGQIFH